MERMEAVKADTAPGIDAMLARFREAAIEAARAAVVAVAVVEMTLPPPPAAACLLREAAAAPM